jgi:hypothetical protein
MQIQNDIKRTLKQDGAIVFVRELLGRGEHKTRASLTRSVCGHFDFIDVRGRAQIAGCIKAMRELEKAGHYVLPAPLKRGSSVKFARRLEAPVPEPVDVPARAEEVRGLALIKVDNLDLMRVWNELMLCEHPQGAGPLVGAQMRFLIQSEHGWLGGFGFGAAALQMADRDAWMGWDANTRRQQLHRVVGMSRFLIRGSVRCHNLASHVLGMMLRRVGAEYEAQYHYAPWLVESFVDTENFIGTSYRAANWQEIGRTRGRGRQDTDNEFAKSVKSIYVYELEPDWYARMGIVEPEGLPALEMTQGLDGPEWAAHEFGGANLGDKRVNEHLIEFVLTQAAMPGRAFCGAAQGDRAAVKAYYRLIDQPDDDQASMQAILAPHQRRTIQRMKAQPLVLCIQDGTDINYSGLVQCEGLGVIGANQTGAQSGGLHLHSTLVLTTHGVPLGVLGAQCSATPAKHAKDQATPAGAVPIEEKKTFAWIQGLRQCADLAGELSETRQICIMDREADFYELFDEQRRLRGVELLVRAKHDRTLGENAHLFETVRQSPVKGQFRIPVPRQSDRAKKSKQKARVGHPERMAQVELRHLEVQIPAPKSQPGKRALTLRVVHVVEPHPPEGTVPLEWFLLTTLTLQTAAQAQACLRWYCLRWRIEDWHRVLKSGCRIEALQHKTAERLKRAIAINLVIAWRIMLMTLLGRECPDLPAEVLFSDPEIEVLQAYAKKNDSTNPLDLEMPCAS